MSPTPSGLFPREVSQNKRQATFESVVLISCMIYHWLLMIQIAQALLFDRDGKLLIYLRDDKPSIPFPNYCSSHQGQTLFMAQALFSLQQRPLDHL